MSELLEGLHQRILDGSRTASRDLFVEASGPLKGFITNRFSRLNEDERHDLVVDAILEYLESPGRYDPARASLWSYLCMVATRNATDLIRKNANRVRLLDKKVQTDVEFWAARAKYEQYGEDEMDARRIMELHGRRLATNESEAMALKLLLQDEKSTETYARAIGVDPQDPDAERVVKQIKDRLTLRMKRLRDEL